MKIAIVHEWFTSIAGSERVVEQMLEVFPEADLFCVCMDPDVVRNTPFLASRKITTTFIQHLPWATHKYRAYLPLMPLAIEQLDVSAYDIVISSAHAVAKGVLTGPDQLHFSYVHSPIRYAWDLQHQYLKESGLTKGAKAWLARWLLHKIRIWDYRTAAGVDVFMANSRFIGRRIRKVYGRTSHVIYPPVAVNDFQCVLNKEDFYLAASRLVPYKMLDVIVKAFSQMPERRLVLIGDGPDLKKMQALATPNVQILGYQPFAVLKDYMARAKAFVFAAEEDFGITPVEALASGTPVIAYGKGGALETVVASSDSAKATGIFFESQTPESIVQAVERFERLVEPPTSDACRVQAERFSQERFRLEFESLVRKTWADFSRELAH